jgi:DNA-binding MarR family transcriptional regulator
VSSKPVQTAEIETADLIYTFFNEIGIIGQLSGTALRRALPAGMTMAQFTVLNHFARLGGRRSPAQLAASFQVTKGAITNTLQKLETKDHIRIETDKTDKRRKLVSLTDAGLQVRNEAIAALTAPMSQLAEQLDIAGMKEALPFLQKIRAELDTARTEEDFADIE